MAMVRDPSVALRLGTAGSMAFNRSLSRPGSHATSVTGWAASASRGSQMTAFGRTTTHSYSEFNQTMPIPLPKTSISSGAVGGGA
jgi:hypothetical protein